MRSRFDYVKTAQEARDPGRFSKQSIISKYPDVFDLDKFLISHEDVWKKEGRYPKKNHEPSKELIQKLWCYNQNTR
jgi:hypothetical protein